MNFRLLFQCGIFFLCCIGNRVLSQNLTQTVRGTAVDAESRFPLYSTVITVIKDSILIGGAAADEQGAFIIRDVPLGKVQIKFTLLGYNERIFDNIEVTSAKEVVLEVLMEQSAADLDAVEIKAVRDGEVSNEMATVSARQFSVSETDRYAGSRGDPARMASNFAGVQGADDSRNDIVIRGNSPQGVLWRLEGVDIPNPNHFSIPGTAGGPVSIINNKYLANSDFFTGAFPADYGNSVSGVFDLRMRNGNNREHEFSAQLGFLGTELFAEGPLSNDTVNSRGSSYLASYRYSTIELFSSLGIDIGTTATPRYQDAAFRLFFPGQNNSALSVWGIGGMSSVDILISDQKFPDERNIYGENDRDQYFKTRMGAAGITYSKSFSEKSFMKITGAVMHDDADSYHELIYRHISNEGNFVVDSLTPLLDYNFSQNKLSGSVLFNRKVSKKFSVRTGLNFDYFMWNYVDSVRTIDSTQCDYYSFRERWNSNDQGYLLQPYVQVKWKPADDLTITAGLHEMVFSILGRDDLPVQKSESHFEPRAGIRYEINRRHVISLGAGRHSQLQPLYMYFYAPEIPECVIAGSDSLVEQTSARTMDFTKSDHVVIGYQVMIKSDIRILTEIYYQSLFNIPVEKEPSSFSLVNTGAGFTRFFPGELENTGTGHNYGIELTIEKFFSRKWLALFTASVFDSKYKGSDGIERDTDFNGRYAMNILASREWTTGRHSAIVTGVKVTTAGGRRYGPADEILSAQQREIVFVDSLRNTLQFDPYFRLDLKINYRLNRKKVTHEIGLDLVNITGQKNVLKLTYAPDDVGSTSDIREEYQLGFLPVFFYKIDF